MYRLSNDLDALAPAARATAAPEPERDEVDELFAAPVAT
jgi:hypothetical protein